MSLKVLQEMNNVLTNPVYQEKPDLSNISIYPTIIDIVEAIAEKEENELSSFSPLRRTILHKYVRPGVYNVVAKSTGSSESYLVPTSILHNLYFRGQSVYYDKCIPSLYRNYSEEKELLSYLQFQEFKLMLESHPIINDLIYTELHHCEIRKPIKLSVNYEGLAQHYGIHTDLLDFTNDKWTAAFFATTSYDEVNSTYSPIDESLHAYGVFYIYKSDPDPDVDDHNMEPLGLNYFNRPGAQNGFAIKMSHDDDLNSMTNVEKIFFRHNRNASQTIFSINQQGKKLFPADSLVEKVKSIMSNRIFSLTAIIRCKYMYYSNLSDSAFQHLLNKYEIESSISPIVSFFNDPIIRDELDYWQREGRKRYIESLFTLPLHKHGDMICLYANSEVSFEIPS